MFWLYHKMNFCWGLGIEALGVVAKIFVYMNGLPFSGTVRMCNHREISVQKELEGLKTKSSNIEKIFDLELVSSPGAINYRFVLDRCKSTSCSSNNYVTAFNSCIFSCMLSQKCLKSWIVWIDQRFLVLNELGIHWENPNETEQKNNPNTISVMFFFNVS